VQHKHFRPLTQYVYTSFIYRCQAISAAIKEVESHKKVQSMVLASSNPSTFSAGLDLNELYNPEPERLENFWSSFQQVFLDLYGSRLAVIGAVGGNAPAAGCMLALSCDYRIMAASPSEGRPPLIGLNETKFGIAAPPFLGDLLLRTIGHRQGELAMSLGTLFTPEQALKIGMVDELVDVDNVLEKSKETALEWARIPPPARLASKMLARKKYLDELSATRKDDVAHFKSFVLNDKVQVNLGAYLESLKKR
jgi:3,2-trans-enoyl-CoA isomerase